MKRQEEIDKIRKQQARDRKREIEEKNLMEEWIRMERFEKSGEIFRMPASYERDHNGNERSRVAFPGCIPLELAIQLRGDGMFYEPDYYNAETTLRSFDQGYEEQQKRMQDEEVVKKTKEEHERKLKEEAERLEAVRQAKEEESRLK